jgi:hypothetical protein
MGRPMSVVRRMVSIGWSIRESANLPRHHVVCRHEDVLRIYVFVACRLSMGRILTCACFYPNVVIDSATSLIDLTRRVKANYVTVAIRTAVRIDRCALQLYDITGVRINGAQLEHN